jgi:hypothetical protein
MAADQFSRELIERESESIPAGVVLGTQSNELGCGCYAAELRGIMSGGKQRPDVEDCCRHAAGLDLA